MTARSTEIRYTCFVIIAGSQSGGKDATSSDGRHHSDQDILRPGRILRKFSIFGGADSILASETELAIENIIDANRENARLVKLRMQKVAPKWTALN
jgi:hypothetical protein